MDFTAIDPTIGAAMVNLASSLSTLVLKGTATAIHSKIESIKNEKNIDTVRNSYNEIVNQLLEEREEAVRIAQTYKEELERIVISDEDIQHLHETMARLIDLAKQFSPDMPIDKIEAIKNLISVDTLKTMQLLGFNYKAAIGEPLTKVCASAIEGLGIAKPHSQGNNQKNRK